MKEKMEKKVKQKRQRISKALSKEERNLLKQNNNIESLTILLLCYTGLRVSELCDLKWEDIDYSEGIIDVKHGKGNKQRYVPLLDYTSELLSSVKKILKSKVYVLETQNGTKYQRQYINNYCKKINPSFHPHMFRHTFSTILYSNGVDLITIQHLLGHSSIRTTQEVYIHPTLADLRKGIKQLD